MRDKNLDRTDLAAKRDGEVIDWGYLLKAADSFKNDLKFFFSIRNI